MLNVSRPAACGRPIGFIRLLPSEARSSVRLRRGNHVTQTAAVWTSFSAVPFVAAQTNPPGLRWCIRLWLPQRPRQGLLDPPIDRPCHCNVYIHNPGCLTLKRRTPLNRTVFKGAALAAFEASLQCDRKSEQAGVDLIDLRA